MVFRYLFRFETDSPTASAIRTNLLQARPILTSITSFLNKFERTTSLSAIDYWINKLITRNNYLQSYQVILQCIYLLFIGNFSKLIIKKKQNNKLFKGVSKLVEQRPKPTRAVGVRAVARGGASNHSWKVNFARVAAPASLLPWIWQCTLDSPGNKRQRCGENSDDGS